MRILRTAALWFLVFVPVPALAETHLLMAEETGCAWCARWDREIAHIYPKTAEGKTAPLRRFNLHGAEPQDVTFAQPIRFTPTFILVRDGAEVGRIEGYPGEDFFWPLLTRMFVRAQIPIDQAG